MARPDQKLGNGAQDPEVNHTGLTDEELWQKYGLEPEDVPIRADLSEPKIPSPPRKATQEVIIFPT